MHFHLIESIFPVFHCLEADSFTLDSTAATAEAAEGDGCFVSVRMVACLQAFFPLLYQLSSERHRQSVLTNLAYFN